MPNKHSGLMQRGKDAREIILYFPDDIHYNFIHSVDMRFT